ncbi:MAG: hypothetical protein ABI841_07345 [Chloroflexota bacterium]
MPNRTYLRPFAGALGANRAAVQRVVVALGLVLAMTTPVNADGGLTGAVAASYFPRTLDAGLHSIAHQRVIEISACPTCMTHNLMRAGTSEVLAYNFGSADPVGDAVRGWQGSAAHNAILSNGSLGSIGCAQTVVGATSYFVCVLAPGGGAVALAPAAPAPAPPAPAAPAGGAPQLALPDTSTAVLGSPGGSRALLA